MEGVQKYFPIICEEEIWNFVSWLEGAIFSHETGGEQHFFLSLSLVTVIYMNNVVFDHIDSAMLIKTTHTTAQTMVNFC